MLLSSGMLELRLGPTEVVLLPDPSGRLSWSGASSVVSVPMVLVTGTVELSAGVTLPVITVLVVLAAGSPLTGTLVDAGGLCQGQ